MSNENTIDKTKSRWIGVNPNINTNSEIQSTYVSAETDVGSNVPNMNKPWTDTTNSPTTLAEKNKRQADTSVVQSQSGVSTK